MITMIMMGRQKKLTLSQKEESKKNTAVKKTTHCDQCNDPVFEISQLFEISQF